MWLGPLTPASEVRLLDGREFVVVDPETGTLVVEKTLVGLEHRYADGTWSWDLEDPIVLEEDLPVDARFQALDGGGWEGLFEDRRVVYDGLGQPIRVEPDDGLALTYVWDDIGLSRIEDAAGTAWHLRYDQDGNLTVVQRSGGDLADLEFRGGRLIAWRGPERRRTRYLYDDAGRLRGILWLDGSRVTIQRDPEGRVRRIQGPGTWTQSYEWTDSGVRVIDGMGLATTITRSPEAIAVSDPVGRSARILLDEAGAVAGWTDPRGLQTTLERTASGRIATIKTPWGTWRMAWSADGDLVTITDPGGSRWGVESDGAGHVVALRSPDGRTLRWDRDSLGRIDAVSRGGPTPVVLDRDLQGRVEAITTPRGAVTRIRRNADGTISSIQDAAGNEVFLPRWNGTNPAQILTRRGTLWSIAHDMMGRPARVEGPRGLEITLSRNLAGLATRIGESELLRRSDGAVTRVTDRAGATWGVVYDIAARPRAVRQPDGSELTLGWNLVGEMTRYGDRTIERDLAGRPLSDGTFSWDWDLAGRLAKVALPSGSVETPRDGGGKVRSVSWDGRRGWSITWDGQGYTSAFARGGARVLVERNPDGLVTGLGEVILERDERGVVFRVTESDRTWRALVDPEGLPSRWTGPDGQSVSVDRDDTGSLTLVRFPDGTLVRRDWSPSWTGLTIEDPDGDVLLDRRLEQGPHGLRSLQERGVTGELDRVVHRDALGDIVALEEALGAWTWTDGQLESPDGALVLFDEAGWPSEATPPLGPTAWEVGAEVLTYIPGSNGCIDTIAGEDGSWRLTHDALGRLTQMESTKGRWRIDWDLFGRPVRISGPEGPRDLIWSHDQLLGWEDADGRTELVGSPEWGWSVWSEQGESVVAMDDTGAPRLHLVAQEVDLALQWTPTGFPREALDLPFAPGAALALMPGGPLLDGAGAWDPVSGARTCSFNQASPIPALDATASPAWDPEPWQPRSPWSHPLELLVTLEQLDPLFAEHFVTLWPEAPPLGWMPQAMATPAPPLGPAHGSLPLGLDPVSAMLLEAAVGPVHSIREDELLSAVLAPELEGQPAEHLPPLW